MSLIRPNTEKYVTARAASGAKSMNNGDAVALAIVGMNNDEIKEVASAMGVEDVNKYDALNVGQIRMNLGNRIRGRMSAIDKERASLEKKAGSEDATAADRKAAQKALTGEEALEAAVKPLRKAVDKRLADIEKAKEDAKAEREAKAAAKAKAEKEAAKGKGKKAA